ncbi:MAG TPA: alpha/beta hydrolase [Puia sp.]|nr:alpha/beta hydrolase [Puia sp.]
MKKSTAGKWTKLQVLSVIFLLSSIAKGYGQDEHKYPPTGKLVDVGGHLLHIHVMGKGEPVVVFENGSGDFSWIWNLVQPEISKTAMTVSYDRAGYAWSEEGPLPRTGRQIAFELHEALQHAGIKGPYIMVGQSFGGFLVRYFARFYRKEVVGLVLVDALNENEKIVINNKPVRVRDMAKGRPAPGIQNKVKKNADTVLPKEENPLASNTAIEYPLDKLSASDQKMQVWAQTQFSYYKAASSEMDWSPEDVADMYKNKGKSNYMLGSIPLIVISKGKGNYSGLPDSAELEKQRLKGQNDLAHLSTNSKHIIDQHSGHNVHLEDPETVIHAIKLVIEAHKTHAKLK